MFDVRFHFPLFIKKLVFGNYSVGGIVIYGFVNASS